MSRRPFPWRCGECGHKEVYAATIDHVTRVKHDGRTYEVHVPQLEAAQCEKCGAIVFDDWVGEQVSLALREQLNLLTPNQIRVSLDQLHKTQKEVAASIGVAQETMSRWCTGALIQSRAMDKSLRSYFASSEVRGVFESIATDPTIGTHAVPDLTNYAVAERGAVKKHEVQIGDVRYRATRALIESAGTTWGKEVEVAA